MDMFAVTLPGFERVCAHELEPMELKGVKPVDGGVESRVDCRHSIRQTYTSAPQAGSWSGSALSNAGIFPPSTKKPCSYRGEVLFAPAPGSKSGLPATPPACCTANESAKPLKQPSNTAWEPLKSARPDRNRPFSPRLDQNICLLSVDSSGDLLHRRGYREISLAAPLRETLAAGILEMLKWRGGDAVSGTPMCGSGSFPIEAALLAGNRAPGAHRSFAFMNWPHYRPGLWSTLLATAVCKTRKPGSPIFASDIDPRAVEASCRNAEKAGVRAEIDIHRANLSDLSPPAGPGLILCNPPYGKRLSGEKCPEPLYREMGISLRQKFPGWVLRSGLSRIARKSHGAAP